MQQTDIRVSQATVYNTLNLFTKVGLLRRIGLDGSRSFFDTKTTPHPHYYVHDEDVLLDIPESDFLLGNVPDALPGHEICCIDLIIHLHRNSKTNRPLEQGPTDVANPPERKMGRRLSTGRSWKARRDPNHRAR